MTPDESSLGRVVALLRECGVPYMLTGSVASGHHGRPRMTQDVDIVIDQKYGVRHDPRVLQVRTQGTAGCQRREQREAAIGCSAKAIGCSLRPMR